MDVMFKWKERKRMFTNSFTFILVQPRTTRFAPSCIHVYVFLYRLEHGQVTLHCAQPVAEAAWPCTRPWLKREGKMDAATQLDVGALQGRALRDRGTCHGWIAIWLRIIVVHPVCASSHT